MLQARDVLLRELLHLSIGVALGRLLIQRNRTFVCANLLVHETLVEVRAGKTRQLVDHTLTTRIELVGNLHVFLIGQFLELIERLLMVLHQALREIFASADFALFAEPIDRPSPR